MRIIHGAIGTIDCINECSIMPHYLEVVFFSSRDVYASINGNTHAFCPPEPLIVPPDTNASTEKVKDV